MFKNIKRLILLLITFIFLYFVFVNVNFSAFTELIQKFDYKYILLLILFIFMSMTCRAFCFKFLLSKTLKNPSIIELILLCFSGSALNILLPARAGDIFRSYYTGDKYNIDKVKILGTVLFERILDVIVIFSLLIFGIMFYHRNPLAEKLCLFAGILFIVALIISIIMYKKNKADTFCKFIINKTSSFPFSSFIEKGVSSINRICNSFFDGFEVIDSPKNIFMALIFSIGIWFFECCCYYSIILSFGCHIHWSVTIFIISFIALACMIPSTSIFIGPYQLAIISAFAIYNVPKEPALAMSIVEQTVVTLFTSLVAFIFLVKKNISYKELKNNIKGK